MGDPAEPPNIWHSSVRWNPYVMRTNDYSMTPLLPISFVQICERQSPTQRTLYSGHGLTGTSTNECRVPEPLRLRGPDSLTIGCAKPLGAGIKQVVILGVGFDCRSIRLPELRRATVFEVDHFDTLRVKRNCLTQIAPFASSSVHYVGIDFNRERVSEALGKAGFDGSRITVFCGRASQII
jgi:Leucine carboxyl methyltransferase